jgi:hypothetical protein
VEIWGKHRVLKQLVGVHYRNKQGEDPGAAGNMERLRQWGAWSEGHPNKAPGVTIDPSSFEGRFRRFCGH